MKERINLVESIKHVKLSAITSFSSNASGLAALTFTSHREVPFVKPSVRGGTDSEKQARGKIYISKYSASLKSEVKEFEPGIILMKLESGETLIIGDQDTPVTMALGESLNLKTLEISHSGWHKPLILVV